MTVTLKIFVSVSYVDTHLCFNQFAIIRTQSTNTESIACDECSIQSIEKSTFGNVNWYTR
jgi:hypothetical protein